MGTKPPKTSLLLIVILVIGTACQAGQTIINLDAYDSSQSNPVIVVLTLEAGTYTITPIGIADGGDYDAWNPWGYVSDPGDGTGAGWVHSYTFDSDQFDRRTISSGIRYATAAEALANATSSSFTLTTAGDVEFYLRDNPYNDNEGGVSLLISELATVPVPSALLLSGFGAVLVTTRRRRHRRNQ